MLKVSRDDQAHKRAKVSGPYVLLAAAVLLVPACESGTDAIPDGLGPIVGEESADAPDGTPSPADGSDADASEGSDDADEAPLALPGPGADAPGDGDDGHAQPADEPQGTEADEPQAPIADSPAPAPVPDAGNYTDITTFGMFHGSSSHTSTDTLAGGRTPITTEAHVAYTGLRAFLGQPSVELEAIGQWAFANSLTNNSEPYGDDLRGVGLYMAMQGAKVGWIRDDAYDPQIIADIQRSAREGRTDVVMTMVESSGHVGYAEYLQQNGLVDVFVNTLKMEPHYGGWMHGRTHGGRPIGGVATAHDVHHLTVLSHDQTQPFMNDTFDWPQWPALDVADSDVINYFQSMVLLGDPNGEGIA